MGRVKAASGDAATGDPATGPRLRLVSYNIRKAVGLDWRRDPHRILRVIAGLDADVVALQEADRRLGPRHTALDPALIERETDLRPVPVARNAVSLGWHGNALLARKSLEVSAAVRIELPGLEPRGAIAARLHAPGGEVTVVGVHLGLRRGCRRLQFAAIIAALGVEAAARAVIMGDFNEWSPLRGFEALSPGFAVIDPGRSFHAARPMASLDRFALGSGLSLRAAGVEAGREARVASDHLPVWAEIAYGDIDRADGGAPGSSP